MVRFTWFGLLTYTCAFTLFVACVSITHTCVHICASFPLFLSFSHSLSRFLSRSLSVSLRLSRVELIRGCIRPRDLLISRITRPHDKSRSFSLISTPFAPIMRRIQINERTGFAMSRDYCRRCCFPRTERWSDTTPTCDYFDILAPDVRISIMRKHVRFIGETWTFAGVLHAKQIFARDYDIMTLKLALVRLCNPWSAITFFIFIFILFFKSLNFFNLYTSMYE